MQRLIPQPQAELSIEQALDELRPWEQPSAGRPRVLSNFAHSLDGRIAVDGSSRSIGSDTDTSMLVGLRTRVDAVMIGAGTMRAERYGRVVGDPAKRDRRQELGLAPDPLMVLVSGGLELPWDAGLFTDGSGEVVVFTSSDQPAPETATPMSVIRHEGGVDLARALRELREDRGIRALLCEGGPSLHGNLIEQELIDEMFVTTVPRVLGGEGPSLVGSLPPSEHPLRLEWLLHEPATDELFARYAVSPE